MSAHGQEHTTVSQRTHGRGAKTTMARLREVAGRLLQATVVLLPLAVHTSVPALVGGKVDTAAEYPAVVFVQREEGMGCTATKIAPRSLLTAAHCVVNQKTGRIDDALASSGAKIAISNSPTLDPGPSVTVVRVADVLLPPALERALDRFFEYQSARPGNRLSINHNFITRFPDVAILILEDAIPGIPVMRVELSPLADDADVILVGYGCRDLTRAGMTRRVRHAARVWGRTSVIRVDAVNFYSRAGQMAEGAPSLCPGDSGGPVLHHGRVVGVHGVVYGIEGPSGARSNMAANLSTLAKWNAWP